MCSWIIFPLDFDFMFFPTYYSEYRPSYYKNVRLPGIGHPPPPPVLPSPNPQAPVATTEMAPPPPDDPAEPNEDDPPASNPIETSTMVFGAAALLFLGPIPSKISYYWHKHFSLTGKIDTKIEWLEREFPRRRTKLDKRLERFPDALSEQARGGGGVGAVGRGLRTVSVMIFRLTFRFTSSFVPDRCHSRHIISRYIQSF